MRSERRNDDYVEGCFIGVDGDRVVLGDRGYRGSCSDSPSMPCEVLPVPSSPTGSVSSSKSPARFIEHTVSKLDTLAGVAIMYGVEVTDIKMMNSLVTDRQMFALKTLRIPLPGRHPPSPCLSAGLNVPSTLEQTPPRRHSDIVGSFYSLKVTPEMKVSPAMSSLQGYYGLAPNDNRTSDGGYEMAVYSKGSANYLEDGPAPRPSLAANPPLSLHRKSGSVANGLSMEDCDFSKYVPPTYPECNSLTSKLARQRQKTEADIMSPTPEKLLKEENTGGWFSAIAGKGLALRNKSASRTNLAAEAEGAGTSSCSAGLGDSTGADTAGVRKSSSTSSLQDQQEGSSSSSSSIFSASKWSLKPDLQALSTVAIVPILDGLSKPISGRKNKAALD